MERRKVMAEMTVLAKPIRDMVKTDPTHLALENGMTWGDISQQEQDRVDAPFVSMTDEEWHAYLRADKSKPWEECQRIMRLRATQKAADNVVPDAPKTCAYWYREYTQFPHLYFASPEEQKQAIADVLEDWWQQKGRWRRGAMDLAARKIQQAWKSYKQDNAFYFTSCLCDGDRMCQECMDYDLTANQCDDYDCRNTDPQHKCYCGDWVCAGDCGVLPCGCIDMCREHLD